MIYTAAGFIAIAATKTALIVSGSANLRPRIKAYKWSTTGTPTSDQGVEVQIRRATALGTSTAYTLRAPDPSDEGLTPVLVAGVNCSVEPTYAAGSWLEDTAFNPRMTHFWSSNGIDSQDWIVAAGAATGIGFQIVGAGGGAGNFLCNAWILQ